MGTSDLIVALSHSAQSMSEHLPSSGVIAVNHAQSLDNRLAVDVIFHDARGNTPVANNSCLNELIQACSNAVLFTLIDEDQSLTLDQVQGRQRIYCLSHAQLEAGELPKILEVVSKQAVQEKFSRRTVLSSLKSVSDPLVDRRTQLDLIKQALHEILNLTTSDFAAFYTRENSDSMLAPVMTSGIALLWPGEQLFNTSSIVELSFSREEIQKAEYVQEVPVGSGSVGAVAMECVVPMIVEQRVIGVVQIAYGAHQSNFDQLCEDLQDFTAVASVVIENETLLFRAKRELERTKALGELSMALHSSGNIGLIKSTVCQWILKNNNAASAGIILFDDHQEIDSQTRYVERDDGPELSEFIELELIDQTIYQWSYDRKESVIISHGQQDPRETQVVHRLRAKEGFGALVCIPMIDDNEVYGLLIVQKKYSSRNFSESELNVLHTVCSQLCIAVHREELLGEIAYKAYHDPLTLLPNRYQFEKELLESLSSCKKRGSKLGLLLLDIDQFKSINETAGHDVGDMLLVLLAERLTENMRSADVVARLGGDEFVVLVPDVTGEANAVEIARRLVDVIVEPFVIDNIKHRLGAQVGISMFPDHGELCEDLLKHAGIAKHSAKHRQRDVVAVFDQEMAAGYRRKLEISAQMQDALVAGQFELYYQPQVCMRTNRVAGVEALIRWNHPDTGIVSPAEFIPIAEKSGFITSIGSWVIDEACRQMALWNQQGITGLTVAVNIAAQQFESDDFVSETLGYAAKHKLDPSSLELEVTESVVMRDIDVVAEKLLSFRDANIKLAIDDFGTGYSSLRYLQDLPLDILKIDRSFVMRLQDTDNTTVAHSIAALAQSLGLLTVAEGVETDEQLARVCKLDVDYVQGYYYSKPLPAQDVPEVIAAIGGFRQAIPQ